MKTIFDETLRLLNSAEVGKRQLGAKDLALIPSLQARAVVVEFLHKEGHAEVLEHLCEAARNCGAVEAEPLLIKLLDFEIGDVVLYACSALEKLGSEAAIEPLRIVLIRSSDEQAKTAALEALKSLKQKQSLKSKVMEQLQEASVELRSSPHSSDHQMARKVEETAYNAPPKSEAADVILPLDGLAPQARSKPEVLAELNKIYEGFGIEHEAAQQNIRIGVRYERDLKLVKKIKSEQRTHCALCHNSFFKTRSGAPYCEVAHIQALSAKGADTIENILVLCANCHKELDLGASSVEIESPHLIIRFADGKSWKFLIRKASSPKLIEESKSASIATPTIDGNDKVILVEPIQSEAELSLFGEDLK